MDAVEKNNAGTESVTIKKLRMRTMAKEKNNNSKQTATKTTMPRDLSPSFPQIQCIEIKSLTSLEFLIVWGLKCMCTKIQMVTN